MQVYAITMVRNEEDTIGHWIDHVVSEGFDGIIIADNMSDDGTRRIIEDRIPMYRIPIKVIDDPEPGYYQSKKMTSLAHHAHSQGADWIFPLDADEIIYCMDETMTVGQRMKGELAGARCLQIQVWNHFTTALDDPEQPNPFVRLGWRQIERLPLFKSAYDFRDNLTITMGNHSIVDPQGFPLPADLFNIGIRHFPYRSPEHFINKVRIGGAAYAASDLDEKYGAHWRGYKKILDGEGEPALIAVFNKWFHFEDPASNAMINDPAPFLRHGKAI